MGNDFMKLRITALCRELGISARKFAVSIGHSTGWVTSLERLKKPTISTEDVNKILSIYPSVSRHYLLTGEGKIFKDDADTLDEYPDSHMPEDYRELYLSYRKDLAETRKEASVLRESYLSLLDKYNHLLENYMSLQTQLLAASEERDKIETKKA